MWVISKFNGTATPKGSYSAKTGVKLPYGSKQNPLEKNVMVKWVQSPRWDVKSHLEKKSKENTDTNCTIVFCRSACTEIVYRVRENASDIQCHLSFPSWPLISSHTVKVSMSLYNLHYETSTSSLGEQYPDMNEFNEIERATLQEMKIQRTDIPGHRVCVSRLRTRYRLYKNTNPINLPMSLCMLTI